MALTSTAPPLVTAGAEAFARANLRHNVLALGADYALFMAGLSFASQSTILPAFAAHLGAPNVAVGAIPAVMTVGWFLPSLFTAAHTTALARRLPFVLRYTVWERVPFLIMALAAFFLAARAPALTLALLLGLLLVITGVGGALMPAWMDIVGRTVTTEVRGRFFAGASTVGAVAGFLGSFATASVLAAVAAPASYGVCFLVASAFMALSYLALALVREPPVETAPPVALRAHLRYAGGLVRRDRNLAWFLVARALAVFGAMAGGFYTVHALRAHGALEWQVGLFTTVLLAGQIVGNAVLGWVADHAGHRLVLILGMAGTAAANVAAVLAPSLDVYLLVFALAGVQMAAINVSALNVLLEFAPREDERPTYIGLGTTAVAPVAFAAPLVAGLIADRFGFATMFALAVVFSVGGLAVMLARVSDPRHRHPAPA